VQGAFSASSGHTSPHRPVFFSGLSLDISIPGVFGVSPQAIVKYFQLKSCIFIEVDVLWITRPYDKKVKGKSQP
jgi:hypothetical protein